jgi:nitric oxide reductase large subunit
MRKHLKTYCEESSVHGFPYIVNRDLHLAEKILWIAALMISFVCCGFLMYEIGLKFNEDKIVTYTSDTGIPVTDVSSFAISIGIDLTFAS